MAMLQNQMKEFNINKMMITTTTIKIISINNNSNTNKYIV